MLKSLCQKAGRQQLPHNYSKDSIISLLEELLSNIQTGKEIYEYIFQKLAQIYRGEIPAKEENLYTYLKLLKTMFAEIELKSPKCYFACSGHCQFNVDLNKILIEVGYSFTININFKISNYQIDAKNPDNNRISNLIKIYFANKKTISVDLQYPFLLIVKEIRKEYIKTLPLDEWINLVVTIVNAKNDLQFHFFVNGENNPSPNKINKMGLKYDTAIKYINFFNNFYGEVSSIFMFSQRESGNPGVNNSSYLSQLKNYSEGLWKKSKVDSFLKVLSTYDSINKENTSNKNKNDDKKRITLLDNLVFMFTPMNTSNRRPNIVEDVFGKFQMQFNGNIRVHKNQFYQKKLLLVGGFSNFYPIAEMFLIYPEILTEQNFEIFLKTIGNTLNFRKQNLKIVNKSKLFKILSMFMEKYPKKVYTENILNALFSLAKTLFINNLETECSNYFNYILLNEKILSKYSENLQSTFWNKLFLFCQSDITQVQTFLNMNRLCLILRFYDRNKYKEMCCQEHLDIVKKEYIGSTKVMNPNMNTKLSQLKDIMNLIIDSSETDNALAFFKLLTLDLSPCLILFIINIFIRAFDKPINEDWKNDFVKKLIEANYEVIIFNTFIHSLPDVRIQLLKFISQIHRRLVYSDKKNNIKTLEEMLKTCLLPGKMFFSKKIMSKQINDNINEKQNKEEEDKTTLEIKEEIKEDSNREQKRIDIKKEECKTEKQENKNEQNKLDNANKNSEIKNEKPKEEHKIIEEIKKKEIKKEEPKIEPNEVKDEIKKETIIKEEPKNENNKEDNDLQKVSTKKDDEKTEVKTNEGEIKKTSIKKEETKKEPSKDIKKETQENKTTKDESKKEISKNYFDSGLEIAGWENGVPDGEHTVLSLHDGEVKRIRVRVQNGVLSFEAKEFGEYGFVVNRPEPPEPVESVDENGALLDTVKVTDTSIEILGKVGQEYRVDGGSWVDIGAFGEVVFNGLQPNGVHIIETRYKATSEHPASLPSRGTEFRTVNELRVTVQNYRGLYDGLPHAAEVENEGFDGVYYSNERNRGYTSEAIEFTEPGVYTAYYLVQKDGYYSVYGETKVEIIEWTMEDVTDGDSNFGGAIIASGDLKEIVPLTDGERTEMLEVPETVIYLKVDDVTNTVSLDEMLLVRDQIKSSEEILAYFDVNLFKKVGQMEPEQIHETNAPVRITLMPEMMVDEFTELLQNGEYSVVRIHNGLAERLDTVVEDGKVSFETDRFSLYALVRPVISQETDEEMPGSIVMGVMAEVAAATASPGTIATTVAAAGVGLLIAPETGVIMRNFVGAAIDNLSMVIVTVMIVGVMMIRFERRAQRRMRQKAIEAKLKTL